MTLASTVVPWRGDGLRFHPQILLKTPNYYHGPGRLTVSTQSQISATISAATKEELDRFAENHGLKKNFVVEQALLFFMRARRELPDEAFVPSRIVLEDESFDRIAAMIEKPPAPVEKLRELMRGSRD